MNKRTLWGLAIEPPRSTEFDALSAKTTALRLNSVFCAVHTWKTSQWVHYWAKAVARKIEGVEFRPIWAQFDIDKFDSLQKLSEI